MHRKLLLFLTSLLCLRAWAEDLPELPEVVVTATRVDSSVIASPGFITVVSAQQIADSGARDFAEAVGGESGVVINDNGPVGSLKTISLRGSTSSQVLVLVDGVRLNTSVAGPVDLSTIPLDNIERIEIVRGGESSVYGSGAIGGVVNIITRKPGSPELSLSVTNGSYIPHDATNAALGTSAAANVLDLVDGQRAALSASGTVGEIGLSAGGSFNRAANAFTWDPGTGAWKRRDHAADLSGDGYAGLRAPFLGGIATARGTFSAATTEVPGSLTTVSPHTMQGDWSASGSLGYKTDRFFTDALTLDVKGMYRYEELSLTDPAFNSLHKTHAAGVDLTQKLSIIPGLAAVYGGSASYELAGSTNMNGLKDRLTLAGFASVPVTLFDALTLTPSIRYDYYSDFPAYLSYQLGVVVLLSDTFSLKASAGTAYRVPLLEDLYWYDPLGYQAGNPNLKPETAYSGEVGVSVAQQNLSIDAAVFARLVYNTIEWDWSLYPSIPVNIAQALMPGAEVHGKLTLLDRISIGVDYTFIYSLLLQYGSQVYQVSDGQRVPYVPVHNVNAEVRYEDGMNSVGAGVQYVGDKQYRDFFGAWKTITGYSVINADYRFTPVHGLAFSVAVKNLLNAVYQSLPNYPMPPLSIETGVHVKL